MLFHLIHHSKLDSIFISSGNRIHIGAKDDITITAKNDLIFNVKNTYLGAASTKRDEDGNLTDAEPMVLGNELVEVLDDLITCLSHAGFIGPFGGPVLPLMSVMSQLKIATDDDPGAEDEGEARLSLKTIRGKLNGIKSKFHYIENNEEDKDPPPSNEGGGNAA